MTSLPLPPIPLALAGRLKALASRLPQQPPSFALAVALNRWMLARLPEDARQALSNRPVVIDVTDLGLSMKLQLGAAGFGLASPGAPVALRVAATAPTFWRLLAGKDDADRLFFERLLVMEGDTEMGLVLKNTLDALGPLWT
jgi:predicted lipid carrier protein YhbT